MEIWKPVDRFFVSNLGRIKNAKTGKILYTNRRGTYYSVRFCKGGKEQWVHRLVAEAFIPNPENKPYVNHKNGNKHDNREKNLEWVTASENLKHSYATGLHPTTTDKILCVELNKVFKNTTEAAKYLTVPTASLNTVRSNIKRCYRGVRPSAYGYTWHKV